MSHAHPASPPGVSGGTTEEGTWMGGMPHRVFLQFGFAGLVAMAFWVQFRDNAKEAREARILFQDVIETQQRTAERRQELEEAHNKQQNERIELIAQRMMEIAHELQRATDALRAAGVKLERAANKMPPPVDEEGTLPLPRRKSNSLFPFESQPAAKLPGGSP